MMKENGQTQNNGTVRSQILLQRLVEKNPDFFVTANGGRVHWRSPLPPHFEEFRDHQFLEAIGVPDPKVPLSEFWPRMGPQWDALGVADNAEKVRVLVEAKAYVEEADTNPSGAEGESLENIEHSLGMARRYFRAKGGHADWKRSFYQYANRLAHLYYLEELNSVPTELWFVYFCDNVGDPESTSRAEWQGAIRLLHSHLGLGKRFPLSHRVREFFVDAAYLQPAA